MPRSAFKSVTVFTQIQHVFERFAPLDVDHRPWQYGPGQQRRLMAPLALTNSDRDICRPKAPSAAELRAREDLQRNATPQESQR